MFLFEYISMIASVTKTTSAFQEQRPHFIPFFKEWLDFFSMENFLLNL